LQINLICRVSVDTEEFGRRGRAPEDAQLPVADREGGRPKGQDVRGDHCGVRDILGTAVFRHFGTTPAIWQSFRL